MNIADIFSGSNLSDNIVAKKIAMKAEEARIKSRIAEFAQQVIDYYSREIELINNDLTYYAYSNGNKKFHLSCDDKKAITDKLNETIKSLPTEISKSIEELTGTVETAEAESKTQEQPKVVETGTSISAIAVPESNVANNIFRY